MPNLIRLSLNSYWIKPTKSVSFDLKQLNQKLLFIYNKTKKNIILKIDSHLIKKESKQLIRFNSTLTKPLFNGFPRKPTKQSSIFFTFITTTMSIIFIRLNSANYFANVFLRVTMIWIQKTLN